MTVVAEINTKFKSGNDVPVDSIRLSFEDWTRVLLYIHTARQVEYDAGHKTGYEKGRIVGIDMSILELSR